MTLLLCYSATLLLCYLVNESDYGDSPNAAGFVQDSKPSEALSKVIFSRETLPKTQVFVAKSLIPGKVNRIEIPIRNDLSDELSFKKMVVSCGCMVVKDFPSVLAAASEMILTIDLRVGTGIAPEKREIRFVTSDGNIWNLLIDCRPIRIFKPNEIVFEIGKDDKPVEFGFALEFEEAAVSSGLVPVDDGAITCVSGGTIVEQVKIRRMENGIAINVETDATRFGLRKSIVENFEIAAPDFRVTVTAKFLKKSLVRVMPVKCLGLRLLNGTQRFVVMAESEVGELGWRGIAKDGKSFPISVVDRKGLNAGEIVEISCGDESILSCHSLEVFSLAKPNEVVFKVLVEN